VRPIDDVTVKGRRSRIPVYELMGAYGLGPQFEPDEATVRLCRLTRNAYEALIADDHDQALSRYQAVLAEYPDDPVSREMVRRLTVDPARRAPLQMSR
jgi:adenylate cyclase